MEQVQGVLPFLSDRGLTQGKREIYLCECSGMLHGTKDQQDKEDVVQPERNYVSIVRSKRSFRPEDRISAVEVKNKLEMNTIRDCLQNKKLLWFVDLESMKKSSWSGLRLVILQMENMERSIKKRNGGVESQSGTS